MCSEGFSAAKAKVAYDSPRRSDEDDDFWAYSGIYGELSGELLDPKEVKKGRDIERDKLITHKVYKEITEEQARKFHPNAKRIRSRWVEDWKGEQPNRIVRCRLVAQEVNTHHRATEETYAGTPPLVATRLLLSRAATQNPGEYPNEVTVYDISVAFLHADMDEEIIVTPPPTAAPKGTLWLLRKAMYGTRRASLLWAELVGTVMKVRMTDASHCPYLVVSTSLNLGTV